MPEGDAERLGGNAAQHRQQPHQKKQRDAPKTHCQCQRGPDVFPFVGRKDSAEGTLSVHDALRAFSIRTMVAAKQTEASRKLLDAIVLGNKSNFINTHFIL